MKKAVLFVPIFFLSPSFPSFHLFSLLCFCSFASCWVLLSKETLNSYHLQHKVHFVWNVYILYTSIPNTPYVYTLHTDNPKQLLWHQIQIFTHSLANRSKLPYHTTVNISVLYRSPRRYVGADTCDKNKQTNNQKKNTRIEIRHAKSGKYLPHRYSLDFGWLALCSMLKDNENRILLFWIGIQHQKLQ